MILKIKVLANFSDIILFNRIQILKILIDAPQKEHAKNIYQSKPKYFTLSHNINRTVIILEYIEGKQICLAKDKGLILEAKLYLMLKLVIHELKKVELGW